MVSLHGKGTDLDIIRKAVEKARETMKNNIGGPFGAAIIDENGEILAISSNTVLGDKDPTAHAEMNAIREACKVKGTHDLTGCIIFATGCPCPMCLSAIIWANIKHVIYSCHPRDAEKIGFRDAHIYKFIERGCRDSDVLSIDNRYREECLPLFTEYAELQKEIY